MFKGIGDAGRKMKCCYCRLEKATEPDRLCKQCAKRIKEKPIRNWKWRLTKHYLFIFRHFAKCSTCVKGDVCRFHDSFIKDILFYGESKGVFRINSFLWKYCDFYLEGNLPDRSLKVERK